jgi:hypothetical protein
VTVLGIPPKAIPAWRALAEALDDCGSVPCESRAEWTSESAEDRQAAAHQCARCPVLPLCSDYVSAAKEKYGVWAGKDRTVVQRPKKEIPA